MIKYRLGLHITSFIIYAIFISIAVALAAAISCTTGFARADAIASTSVYPYAECSGVIFTSYSNIVKACHASTRSKS